MLRGEALGARDCAWNGHWNHNTAGIASRGEGYSSDSIPAGGEAQLWSTAVAGHAGCESGCNVIVLERDYWPFCPERFSQQKAGLGWIFAEILQSDHLLSNDLHPDLEHGQL